MAYAPNRNERMKVVCQLDGRGERADRDNFKFNAMRYLPDTVRVMTGIWGKEDRPFRQLPQKVTSWV